MQKAALELIKTIEHEDGSATLTFDISEDMKDKLVQYALKDILSKLADKEILKTLLDNQVNP